MNKKKRTKQQRTPAYTMIPGLMIAVFIAVMPLLALPLEIVLTEAELMYIPNSGGVYVDIYQRFREIILFTSGVLLLLFWLGERIFPDSPVVSPLMSEKRAGLPIICCGAYLMFAVISALFSEYGEVSFWGAASDNVGVAAVFGCVVLFLAAYNWLRGRNLRFLEYAVLASACVISLLYIVECVTSATVGELIFGIADDRVGLSLLFGNPVACGEFSVLLFPVLFLCGSDEDRLVVRIADFLAAGVLLCTVVSSCSTASFVGILIASLLILTILLIRRKEIDRKKLKYSPLVLLPLAVLLIADTQETLLSIQTEAENCGVYDPANSCHLRNISIGSSDITLECESCTVTISLSGENTAVITGTDGEVLAALENSSAKLSGDYSPISVSLYDRLLVLDLGYKDTIEFETTGGRPVYIGLNGYLTPEPSDSAFPELSRYYRVATGRGYIWLSSIPLLKDCLFKGYGAGQFLFHFPQDDIVGMLNTHGTTALCTDKPHDLYLGIALSHGIPALAVFLCLVLAVLKRSCGKLRNVGFAVNGFAVSIICFLVMGIVNDSNVIYSPLFWIFAGAAAQPVVPRDNVSK